MPLPEHEPERSAVQSTYANSIMESGGLPILLPLTTDEEIIGEYSAVCDGFLFTGGVDIEPKRYGEVTRDYCKEIDLLRDEAELTAFPVFYEANKPIMGICRGAQLINIALGGTLYQDLQADGKTDKSHSQSPPYDVFYHNVKLVDGTPLKQLVNKETVAVNSIHHQAIKDIATSLTPCAFSDDGVIEAAYSKDRKHIRIYQWHPERTFKNDLMSKMIFEDFIKACKS